MCGLVRVYFNTERYREELLCGSQLFLLSSVTGTDSMSPKFLPDICETDVQKMTRKSPVELLHYRLCSQF